MFSRNSNKQLKLIKIFIRNDVDKTFNKLIQEQNEINSVCKI